MACFPKCCRLIVCVLVLSLVPLAVQAQSLGEVARQLRAERQQSGVRQGKVYTNEDLETPREMAEPATAPEEAAPAATAKAEEPAKGEAKEKKKTLEEEMKERDEELKQRYGKLLGDLRADIAKTEKELKKLQHDKVISTNQFRASNLTSPNVHEYEAQQRMFDEQIDAANRKLEQLRTHLQDAQEEARHAGVRSD
jgi:hypothetical protein